MTEILKTNGWGMQYIFDTFCTNANQNDQRAIDSFNYTRATRLDGKRKFAVHKNWRTASGRFVRNSTLRMLTLGFERFKPSI